MNRRVGFTSCLKVVSAAILVCFTYYVFLRYDISKKSIYYRWKELSEAQGEREICSRINQVSKKNTKVVYPERTTNYSEWTPNLVEWKRLRLNQMTEEVNGEDHLLIYKSVSVEPGHLVFSKQTKAEIENLTYQKELQKDCAIVGNSGILLNSDCGHEIDSHSMVVRMSLNPIANFSRDAGTKTNVTYINREKLFDIYDHLTAKDDSYHTILEKLRFLNDSVLWYALGLDGLTITDGDQDEVNKCYGDLAQILKGDLGLPIQLAFSLHSIKDDSSRLWRQRNPSSGFNVLTWALTACQRLNLYGFFPFHHDAYCRPVTFHYSDPKYTINYPLSIHHWQEEFLQLKQLHRRGVLRLVTGQCPHHSGAPPP